MKGRIFEMGTRTGHEDDASNHRSRGMEEVARSCRARERSCILQHRVGDAALYAEVAERAEAVLERERELGYARRTVSGDAALRQRIDLNRRAAWPWGYWLALVLAVVGLGLLCSCS